MTARKVCVIDDDEIYQFTIRHNVLKLNNENSVLKFINGQQAIDFFWANQKEIAQWPDVIFLDINMPTLDGWGFLEQFATIAFEAQQSVTLYVVSSSIDEIDYNRAMSIPLVHDYIIKPLTLEKLQSLIYQ
jgi:two-component SAPR family response regulator